MFCLIIRSYNLIITSLKTNYYLSFFLLLEYEALNSYW